MHTFIKGYLISKNNLQQFVMQYDNCLINKVQKEYELDVSTFNTIIPYATISLIEKQFQKKYTHEESEHDDKVFDFMYEVLFDSSTSGSKRMLCRHSLFGLGLERVKKLSEKSSHDPSHLEPVKKRYDEMCNQLYNIAEITA
ncbi:hypothetical protein Ahy_B06g084404 [Arachis hypogaea]|uniref:Protein FAR1-RELATED SEQUENCE n=1 Tax=Arachis hypogaea TaxID=3818 RepID=A0A444YRS7_ARAHY|nr:hypothetical protein Ahy_B06g084404 [Arachis hypogaea]